MEWTKRVLAQLKFWEQCSKYGLSIWQCPNFLFILMGAITIGGMIGTYFVANFYAEPFWVAASVIAVATFIFTTGWVVVDSFEKLASASRLKTEFVSIVSHQLRTPLSSIKWSLEILLSGRLGEIKDKQLEQLSILKEGNDRMIKLVNDLLNVTRIEQGRTVLRKEEFKMGDLIKELVREVSSYARANNVVIEVKKYAPEIKVLADRQYISIVLSNLIDNAIRYIEGSGKVIILLKKKDSRAYLEVKDNGVGIPATERNNIFHKFFRSSNALRHRTEGSGLGLYLARAFIEMHGGKIDFSSKEGEGSTFFFTLPLK